MQVNDWRGLESDFAQFTRTFARFGSIVQEAGEKRGREAYWLISAFRRCNLILPTRGFQFSL